MFKLTLNQIVVFLSIIGVGILLALLGWKSAKLKKTLTQLFIKKSELEYVKAEYRLVSLKTKERVLDVKRREKAIKYRNYLKSVNKSLKSAIKSKRNSSKTL